MCTRVLDHPVYDRTSSGIRKSRSISANLILVALLLVESRASLVFKIQALLDPISHKCLEVFLLPFVWMFTHRLSSNSCRGDRSPKVPWWKVSGTSQLSLKGAVEEGLEEIVQAAAVKIIR